MLNSLLQTIAWAVTPDYLDKIDAVMTAHFSGQKLDIKAIEAQLGRRLQNDKQNYEIVDGVAVIPVLGAIGKRMNLFMQISGGVSTEVLRADVQSALDDPAVEAIVLQVDSPGGTVDGSKELADWLRAQRGGKPIYTYADGLVASAAYWIGSATEKLFGYDTANIGSIGVVVTHYDYSGQDEKFGVKRTMVTAGKYKRIASDNEPLSQDGRDYLQAMVDDVYSLFVDGVAESRGVDADTVIKDMADGRIFLAGDALKRGMIDGIATLEETINAARAAAQNQNEEKYMNAEQIKEKFPEAAAALVAEGKGQVVGDTADAVKVAVEEEKKRLTGIHTMMHGDEASKAFTALADSGLTMAQASALQSAGMSIGAQGSTGDAEARTKQEILDALKNSSNNDPGTGKGHSESVKEPEDFGLAVEEYVVQHPNVKKSVAVKIMSKKFPNAYKAYIDKANNK